MTPNGDDPLPVGGGGKIFSFVNNGKIIAITILFLTGTAFGLFVGEVRARWSTGTPLVPSEKEAKISTLCSTDGKMIASDEILRSKACEEKFKQSLIDYRAEKIRSILAGYPMAEMAEELAKLDPQVSSFLIGIAKQESNWGKRAPWKAGRDCFNYWGYKTSGSRGQALGHACFGSRAEAVFTVGKRVEYFVIKQKRDSAQKMLVWKCGRSCVAHNPAGVRRWVAVVDRYRKLLPDPS